MTIFRLVVLVGLTVSLGVLGCGPAHKTATKARVSGKVTLDGKPLIAGTITFDPNTGEPPAVMQILDGNYEGKAAIGKNQVRLSATRKVSMREKMGFDGPGYDSEVEENALPARYNNKSQITKEVEAGEDNRFNFDLNSKE